MTLTSWYGESNYWGTSFTFVPTDYRGFSWSDSGHIYLGFDRTLSPGQVENVWCEAEQRSGSCNPCLAFGILTLSVR